MLYYVDTSMLYTYIVYIHKYYKKLDISCIVQDVVGQKLKIKNIKINNMIILHLNVIKRKMNLIQTCTNKFKSINCLNILNIQRKTGLRKKFRYFLANLPINYS